MQGDRYFLSRQYRVTVFIAFEFVSFLAMPSREHQEGVSGKIILFIVLGIIPAIFMLIVLLFGPMLGLRFGA